LQAAGKGIIIQSGRTAHYNIGLRLRRPYWTKDSQKEWYIFRGQVTALICVSEYTRKQLEKMDIKLKETIVIPNGADQNIFRILPNKEITDFRSGLGAGDGKIILTVGNVSYRKGQDVVIRSMPYVLKESPGAHYFMAGLPTKKYEFENIARQLNIEKYVHFLGNVDNKTLLLLLNSCDIFVMTSRHSRAGDFEGYGIAVLEAALCGKPSVVTLNCGLVEAVAEGQTGLCVTEDDISMTAKTILRLLKDKDLRLNMGSAARRRALSEQTWEKRVKEYDAFLRRML
jgi:phosphatidylinositol alpha-1,6-mannosyltransferase